MDGLPRQVYRDVSLYNEALIIEPKANHLYPIAERIPIKVYSAAVASLRDWAVLWAVAVLHAATVTWNTCCVLAVALS